MLVSGRARVAPECSVHLRILVLPLADMINQIMNVQEHSCHIYQQERQERNTAPPFKVLRLL